MTARRLEWYLCAMEKNSFFSLCHILLVFEQNIVLSTNIRTTKNRVNTSFLYMRGFFARARNGTRTHDLRITNALLYRLS